MVHGRVRRRMPKASDDSVRAGPRARPRDGSGRGTAASPCRTVGRIHSTYAGAGPELSAGSAARGRGALGAEVASVDRRAVPRTSPRRSHVQIVGAGAGARPYDTVTSSSIRPSLRYRHVVINPTVVTIPSRRHRSDRRHRTGRRLRCATNNVEPSVTPACNNDTDSSNISQPFSFTENSSGNSASGISAVSAYTFAVRIESDDRASTRTTSQTSGTSTRKRTTSPTADSPTVITPGRARSELANAPLTPTPGSMPEARAGSRRHLAGPRLEAKRGIAQPADRTCTSSRSPR